MSRAFTRGTGEELVRHLSERVGRMERGGMKARVPLVEAAPEGEVVDGARLYVLDGQLRVRIGTADFSVDLTPVPAPPPE